MLDVTASYETPLDFIVTNVTADFGAFSDLIVFFGNFHILLYV